MFDGTVPLIVELKAAKNHGALVDAAVKALRGYRGAYCVESFDPRCLWHLRRWHPDIIRGQLSQNFMKSDEKLSGVTKFVLTHLLTNFLTRPDFVAYRFTDRKELSVTLARKLWGVQGVVWTLTDNEQHAKALKEGYLPIFENYEPFYVSLLCRAGPWSCRPVISLQREEQAPPLPTLPWIKLCH